MNEMAVILLKRTKGKGVNRVTSKVTTARIIGHADRIFFFGFAEEFAVSITYPDEGGSCVLCYVGNPFKPNYPYRGRTALLNSKRCISYIYSTNTGTEYFKHGIYSPFFPLQNAVSLIILTYFIPVLFIFYIQVC